MAPPPTHIPFTRTDGSTVNIAWFDVSLIRPDAENPSGRCYVYDSHDASNTDPWHIADSYTNVMQALHNASGLINTLTAPFALLTMVAGVPVYAAGRNVPAVRADVDDANLSYLFLSAQQAAFHLDAPAALVANALVANDPTAGQYGGSTSGGPGSVLALALVAGNGTLLSSFGPIVAGPYVPGSGAYSFPVPVLPAGSLIAVVTQNQTPALDIVYGVDCNTPGYVNVSGRVIGGGVWGDYAFDLAIFRVV